MMQKRSTTMKKVMSILLAVALVFQLGLTALAEETHTLTMTTENANATVGDYVYVTIAADKEVQSKGMEQRIFFNTEELQYDAEKSSKGTDNSFFNLSTSAKTDKTYGTYVLYSFFSPTSAVTVKAGTYCTLAFKTLKAGPVKVETNNVRTSLYTSDTTVKFTPNAENTVTFTVAEKPAHTHTYGTPSWNWAVDYSSAKAIFSCTSGDDTQELDAKVTTDTSDATKTVYTATVSFQNSTYTDTKEVPVAAANGYTITAEEDKTASLGEDVVIPVKINSSKETTFNSYDLTVTYDTAKLTYKEFTSADEKATVEDTNGSIRIIGYGENKNVGTAAVTLKFTTKAVGESKVTVSSAKVDKNQNATMHDAPAASIVKSETKVDVNKVTVIKPDTLSGNDTATPGTDYTFSQANKHYDYSELKVMAGETDITDRVTSGTDGSYTIPGTYITGNITITVTTTPKSYDVKVEGIGKADVVAAAKATYNTDYTFSINQVGGYKYDVSVTVNGQNYTLNDGYKIPGTDITGDIVITVTKTETSSGDNTVTVTKPDYVTGGANATKGQDYTFSITKEDDYSYGEPVVKVGGTDISADVTYNKDTKTYTIPGGKITDAITIEVTRTDVFTLEVSQYLTLNEKVMYLVTASGVKEGKCAKYDGQDMYFSDEYKAYAWLVISGEDLETVKATAAEKTTIAVADNDAIKVNYTGDVNGSGIIDVNDAQLTYDIYSTKYSSFEKVSILKFLNADVNHDKTVSTEDAAAIVDAIKK